MKIADFGLNIHPIMVQKQRKHIVIVSSKLKYLDVNGERHISHVVFTILFFQGQLNTNNYAFVRNYYLETPYLRYIFQIPIVPRFSLTAPLQVRFYSQLSARAWTKMRTEKGGLVCLIEAYIFARVSHAVFTARFSGAAHTADSTRTILFE